MVELEIEYECYGVRTLDTGRTRTPSPKEERELLDKGTHFGDLLHSVINSNKIVRVERLEFIATDQDSGHDWHIREIDLTEAVQEYVEDKLQLLDIDE